MKILFSILLLFLATKECNDSKKNSFNEGNQNSSIIDQNDTMYILYTKQSRGLFEEVLISKNSIKLIDGQNSSSPKTGKISEKDWTLLQKMVGDLNLEQFSELKAPTDKRLYDGAPMATLKLMRNGKELVTPTFDHGHPPQAIEALVNKVLSLKESMSKE